MAHKMIFAKTRTEWQKWGKPDNEQGGFESAATKPRNVGIVSKISWFLVAASERCLASWIGGKSIEGREAESKYDLTMFSFFLCGNALGFFFQENASQRERAVSLKINL